MEGHTQNWEQWSPCLKGNRSKSEQRQEKDSNQDSCRERCVERSGVRTQPLQADGLTAAEQIGTDGGWNFQSAA